MNILFCGVGGQGILLASEIAARAAVRAGFDVKKTEVHGVAQRGGSVVSHVRFSEKVYSPLTPAGMVDILIALEQLEGLRWAHYVKKQGEILMNRLKIPPAQSTKKIIPYPENVEEFLKSKGYLVHLINDRDMANGLGNPKVEISILL
jgi:indolepyruvate ferredoxin oxidoreductase beta subunit